MRSTIIAVLILSSTLSLWAQEFKALEDSLEVESFMTYVGDILTHQRDSVVYTSESVYYRCMYRTTCPYTEVIASDGSDGLREIGSTRGESFLIHKQESDWPYGRAHERRGMYLCAQGPYICIDSMEVVVSSEGLLDASSILSYPTLANLSVGADQWEGVASYGDHAYLVVERSMIFNIGSQTSRGNTETYYLERVE